MPQKLIIELPYDPTIALLELDLKEMEWDIHSISNMWIFIATLFIMAKSTNTNTQYGTW